MGCAEERARLKTPYLNDNAIKIHSEIVFGVVKIVIFSGDEFESLENIVILIINGGNLDPRRKI